MMTWHPAASRADTCMVGDVVDVAGEPVDHFRAVIEGVLVEQAEDPDLDAVDLFDDRLLDHGGEGMPVEIDVGVEKGQGHRGAAGDQPADDPGQSVHPQVEFMVAERHRVVEALHDLQLGIAQVGVEFEAADEHVPGVKGQDVRSCPF